jgi:type I restriction enzyme M protein
MKNTNGKQGKTLIKYYIYSLKEVINMSNYNDNQKDEIIEEGIKKGIIKIKDDKVIYPNGKSYNFKDPEEKVRARVFIELVEKYKYSEKRLDTEVTGPRREPKLPADIVVYQDDEKETAFIVVETKAESTKKDIEEAKREGLGNANLLNAKYLLVVCASERMSYNLEKHPSTVDKLEKYRIADIPVKYGKEPKFRFKRGDKENDLRKVTFNELSNKFQLCHDEIWEGGKRDPAVAFDEISKLLITKLYDERFTPAGEHYKFQIGTYEEPKDVAKRIREIYETVQKKNSDVFKAKLELPDAMIFRIVEHLQDISLRTTDLDAKGRAFENFLGKLFRGEYGQYFTPRQIVEFMVEVIDPDENDYLIDPACGSGGFLLYSMKHVLNKVTEKYKEDKETIDRLNWDFSRKQIFGIEINDRIARVAMMDMVIHEDGHSNIECNDALTDYKKFDPKKDIKPNKYDILLTNPPFGAVVKDEEILRNFELGKGRKAQRSEILFIERCLDLLKSGWKMGIVLPDGILTNSSLQYVRDFINKNAKILAVVSLPQLAFVSSGAGVKASLLFLQKKKEGEKATNYPIFMAIAEHIGYDATGRPDANDLPNILGEWKKFLRNPKTYTGV